MFQVIQNWWSVSYLKTTCVAILRTSLSHFFISSFVVKFLVWGGQIVLWAPHMSGICLLYGSTFCAWLGHFVRPIIKILVNDADFMPGNCYWQCFDHGLMYLNRFMVLTDQIHNMAYQCHKVVTLGNRILYIWQQQSNVHLQAYPLSKNSLPVRHS